MTIICDARERLPEIVGASDGQRLLEYAGENGEPFSYDLLVELDAGGVVKVERKALRSDAVGSWLEGKLPRQLAAVDLFCLEMPDEMDLAVQPYTKVEENFLKHLEYVKLAVPVWQTSGPGDTMRRLRWLAERRDGLVIRPNRIEGQGSRESARAGILRAVMTGSGHSPDRVTASGTVGAQLEGRVDWAAVALAMGIEMWADADRVDWAGRRPSPKALAKMRERVCGPPQPAP